MNIIVFDTETTSLEKPFCYNIGYVITDTDTNTTLLRREFVVEQVWHNLELFSSAYYAEKRPIYVSAMKGKKAVMDKFGYICRQMRADIKNYEISQAYAYNCKFDEKVFDFMCEWYKVSNPLDNVQVYDIRGYVCEFVANTQEYQDACENYEWFTESKNYSTTAETLYRYITNNPDFIESHTALDDSLIETAILHYCIEKGGEYGQHYNTPKSISRFVEQTLVVVHNGIETPYNYTKKTTRGNKIFLK